MSLNHLLTQSLFSNATGMGGRKEDISVNNLTLDDLTIVGNLDVAGNVGIGAVHSNNVQLRVQESSADAIVGGFIGNSTSTTNFLTPPVLVLQNSNNTVNNHEALLFLNSGGGITSFITSKNLAHNVSGSGNLLIGTSNAGAATAWVTITNDGKTGIGVSNPANVGGIDVGGAATIRTTLEVKDATTLDTTLEVKDATTLDTTLEVKGATTLDTTLEVKGATTLDTTLEVKGATTLDNATEIKTGNLTVTNGNVAINTTGKSLTVKGGAGGRIGLVQLVSGSATVSGLTLTANSRIFCQNNGTGGTPGSLEVAINTGAGSFTIQSSAGASDSSYIAYFVLEQS